MEMPIHKTTSSNTHRFLVAVKNALSDQMPFSFVIKHLFDHLNIKAGVFSSIICCGRSTGSKIKVRIS